MNISPVIAEWIKQGLDYLVHSIEQPNYIVPISIAANGEGTAFLNSSTEGLMIHGSIIADSPYIGVRLKSGHPTTDTQRNLNIEAANILGLTSPNNYIWVSRYGVVVTYFGVNYTIYAMNILQEYHWYKDFTLTPINIDPALPHNIYAYSYAYYEPLDKRIRPPIGTPPVRILV